MQPRLVVVICVSKYDSEHASNMSANKHNREGLVCVGGGAEEGAVNGEWNSLSATICLAACCSCGYHAKMPFVEPALYSLPPATHPPTPCPCVSQLLPPELSSAAVELLPYWLDSFGNPTRIDYGTGHETTFVAFLYCLAALGLVTEGDRAALVCVVFDRWVGGGGGRERGGGGWCMWCVHVGIR